MTLACLKFFSKILAPRYHGSRTHRRKGVASKYEANGASTLGGVGFSQKVRKLGGNCFLSSLNSIIRYFRPIKARIAKVVLSSRPNWRARN